MEMRFSQLADSLPEKLQCFSPFPTITDRTAYAALPPEVKNQILKIGESYFNYDFPALRATDFMSFKRTGNRADFETRYFARRQALNFLVLAEFGQFVKKVPGSCRHITAMFGVLLLIFYPILRSRCWIFLPVRPALYWHVFFICSTLSSMKSARKSTSA